MNTNTHPQSIGRYEVLRMLGAGAMGCVYLAEDPRLKRRVAIKVVKTDMVRNEIDRKEILARFEREAEISGILNDPAIVTVHDLGESELGPFLVMEYVAGLPLDAWMHGEEGHSARLSTRLQILASVGMALDHAHQHGIIHRDIKPGNVMLTEDGRPKLMDFGIAKREDASLTQTGTFLGTPSYASPEQIKEGLVSPRSDGFSFAVMAFELLAGGLPFPGNSINTILYRIVNEPPVEIHPPVVGLMPEAWRRIFLKALAKNPEDRYDSCAALVKDLVTAAGSLSELERLEILGLLKTRGAGPAPSLLTLRSEALPPDPKATLVARAHAAPKARWPRYLVVLLLVGTALGLGWIWSTRTSSALLLRTQPAGAKVLQAGKDLGVTPLPLRLKPGEAVDLSLPGFKPSRYLHQKGTSPSAIVLEPDIRRVQITTEPPGATVRLDGEPLSGGTPLELRWDLSRTHSLTCVVATAEGELGFARDYKPGEVPDAAPLKLTRGELSADVAAPASIKLQGGYSVRVRLNGKDRGELKPGTSLSLPAGEYRLDMAQPRVFFQQSTTFSLKPGQQRVVVVPETAPLSVFTFPGSGLVVIDGVVTDLESDGNGSVPVAKGRHVVSVKGHPASQQTVDVDGPKQARFRLIR